jgi:hypothetical protein
MLRLEANGEAFVEDEKHEQRGKNRLLIPIAISVKPWERGFGFHNCCLSQQERLQRF